MTNTGAADGGRNRTGGVSGWSFNHVASVGVEHWVTEKSAGGQVDELMATGTKEILLLLILIIYYGEGGGGGVVM